jgi:murein DD-endopeptidase MepM/ murein hydrolase activator NlpD
VALVRARTQRSGGIMPIDRTHIRRAAIVVAALISIAGSAAEASECWRPPVAAPVADPFVAPACRWCPGNRGIEYATTPGTAVRAVRAGTVSFAGSVAGIGYVVVEHPGGRRATYGALASIRVGRGDVVLARSVVGVSGVRLHFGLRDGRRYIDPTPYLGRLVHPTRLVPHDGSPAAPAGRPRLRCRR